MSSAIVLPFFFHKLGSRTFDELFDVMFGLHPGLKSTGIQGGVLISNFSVTLGPDPGDESLRIALALRDAMRAHGLEDDVLSSRLDWFVRDYIAVGSILAEAQDQEPCVIRGPLAATEVSPYVFGTVLSALLRRGQIDANVSTEAVAERQISFEHWDLELALSVLDTLIAGSDEYRVVADTVPPGRQELEQLQRIRVVLHQ